MLFTFRRDAEGRETIHVGDVCVARFVTETEDAAAHKAMHWRAVQYADGVTNRIINDATERADEAGFWSECVLNLKGEVGCIVNVPVAETKSTILSLTTEDER